MPIVTIGIDLAKNVFAVHGVDETGKAMLIKPRVPRDQLATLIAQLPACLIGMEACSGAHPILNVPRLSHRLIHNCRRDRRHVTFAMSWRRHEPL